MLKGALRMIDTVKPSSYWGGVNKVDGEVLCPKLSIFKRVVLRINVKTKKLLGSVRFLKRTDEQPENGWLKLSKE